MKTGSFKTFRDTLNFVLTNSDFSNISVLYNIMGTFQASSADCERGFYIMNTIKTKYRNKLEIDHLGDLLRIKLHLVTGAMIDTNQIFKVWSSMKRKV